MVLVPTNFLFISTKPYISWTTRSIWPELRQQLSNVLQNSISIILRLQRYVNLINIRIDVLHVYTLSPISFFVSWDISGVAAEKQYR